MKTQKDSETRGSATSHWHTCWPDLNTLIWTDARMDPQTSLRFHASPLCLTFSIHFILLFLHCSHPPGANYDMQTLQSLESQDFNYNIQSMPVSDDFLEFLLPTWHFTASCLETVGLRQKKRERHLMSLTNAAWWILLPPGSLLPALVQSTTSWLPILWLTINRHYSQVL